MIIDNLSGSVFHHYSSPAMCEKCNHDKQEVTCVRGCVRGLFPPRPAHPHPRCPQVVPCVLLTVDCVDSRACCVCYLLWSAGTASSTGLPSSATRWCLRWWKSETWQDTGQEWPVEKWLWRHPGSSCCVQSCKKRLGSGSCWTEDSKDLTPMRALGRLQLMFCPHFKYMLAYSQLRSINLAHA